MLATETAIQMPDSSGPGTNSINPHDVAPLETTLCNNEDRESSRVKHYLKWAGRNRPLLRQDAQDLLFLGCDKMLTYFRMIAIGCMLVSLGGCATLGFQSKDGEKGESEFLENLKALKGTGPTAGVSRKAREIESRLGGLQ